jgi:hypothetical protein
MDPPEPHRYKGLVATEKNPEWARETLTRYREALEHQRATSRAFRNDRATNEQYYESIRQATQLQPVAWTLIQDLVPGATLPTHSLHYGGTASEFIDYVDQAIGALDGYDELTENWPREPQVSLDSSGIHPWVWDPAKDLWEIGRYKEALHTAALTVTAKLQDTGPERP